MSEADRRKRQRKRHRQSCPGKRRYKTKAEALDHVFGMRRNGRGFLLQAYRCRACGFYHVGNSYKARA